MKARRCIGFVATLLLAASSLPADDAKVREELAAEYAAYDRAALKGITGLQAWCEQNLADDFTVTERGSTRSRQEFMELIRQMVADPNPIWQGVKAQETTIDRLEIQGDAVVAHVTGRGEYEGKDIQGRFGPKDAIHTFAQTAVYRETWVRQGNDWKVRASEQLEQTLLIDGKPLPPGWE